MHRQQLLLGMWDESLGKSLAQFWIIVIIVSGISARHTVQAMNAWLFYTHIYIHTNMGISCIFSKWLQHIKHTHTYLHIYNSAHICTHTPLLYCNAALSLQLTAHTVIISVLTVFITVTRTCSAIKSARLKQSNSLWLFISAHLFLLSSVDSHIKIEFVENSIKPNR